MHLKVALHVTSNYKQQLYPSIYCLRCYLYWQLFPSYLNAIHQGHGKYWRLLFYNELQLRSSY